MNSCIEIHSGTNAIGMPIQDNDDDIHIISTNIKEIIDFESFQNNSRMSTSYNSNDWSQKTINLNGVSCNWDEYLSMNSGNQLNKCYKVFEYHRFRECLSDNAGYNSPDTCHFFTFYWTPDEDDQTCLTMTYYTKYNSGDKPFFITMDIINNEFNNTLISSTVLEQYDGITTLKTTDISFKNDQKYEFSLKLIATNRWQAERVDEYFKFGLIRIAQCSNYDEEDVRIISVDHNSGKKPKPYNILGNSIVEPSNYHGSCLNGGYIIKESSKCVCPPGFKGQFCETGCGENSYGSDCKGVCSIQSDMCRGKFMCTSYGCTCPTGLTGPSCNEECTMGTYGADCKQFCSKNCLNDMCDKYTGICLDGCSDGYIPPHCSESFFFVNSNNVHNIFQVNTYRFSISWPRVLPNGDDRFVNEPGVNYYKSLISTSIVEKCVFKLNHQVTMYHWDLPNILQDLGGWSNPNIVGYFENYANFLFKTFGSQVKLWTTINEPRFVAIAYGDETFAPNIGEVFNGIADYMAIRNALLSHAAAYKLYKKKYFAKQQGEISLCFDTAAYFPVNPDSPEDNECVSKAFDFSLGVFTQPLKNGTFPQSLLDQVARTDKHENISLKRIVEFTESEKQDLIRSYDFIAFNYYDSYNVRPMTEDEFKAEKYLLNKDLGVKLSSNADNMDDTFKGFTQVVEWFVKNLDNPKLFVTENGIYEKPNVDESEKKIKYHRGILTEIHKALNKGVVIKGYCVWSFMDSLEWTSGYFKKLFGIYSVDFNDPERPRTKKPSFEFFRKVFTTRTLPPV
eukprot:XP_016660022.1 PREDICTED: lactase-phlorizin hydrolase [Acyrthosiphon pisum]